MKRRVKPEVSQRYDYFHNELVATLAEGDEAKLGSAYPVRQFQRNSGSSFEFQVSVCVTSEDNSPPDCI